MSIDISKKILLNEWSGIRRVVYKTIAESVEEGTTVGKFHFEERGIVVTWLLKINVKKP